jgi:hypothetical protein
VLVESRNEVVVNLFLLAEAQVQSSFHGRHLECAKLGYQDVLDLLGNLLYSSSGPLC